MARRIAFLAGAVLIAAPALAEDQVRATLNGVAVNAGVTVQAVAPGGLGTASNPMYVSGGGGGGGGGAVTAASGSYVDGFSPNVGNLNDAAYGGSGNGSLTAIEKGIFVKSEAIRALLANTLTVTGSVTVTGTVTVNNMQINGATISTGRAVADGGTQRVAISTDSTLADTNNAAFPGEIALTVGTAGTAGRSLKVNCTAAGAVSVTYSDATTGVWNAAVGTNVWPIAVTTINSSGTTATCTYGNLK